MKRAVFSVCVSATVVVVGCVVSVSDFAGKSCEIAEDCPDPYVCVAARPGAGRTCEALGLPGTTDGGGPAPGPVPTWCADVQPLLTNYCLASCHGAVQTGSGRTDFRLDNYETVGSIKGAREMASRLEVRVVRFKDMPPQGNPAPSAEERELIGQWALGGTPLCNDGADGGTPADGGTDGGR
ncbi:hypothetical protein [Hyalangium gracile]|uniref:hypothetical protein n=1 Tax=Hyalangium gracile TaxID=394092 RepID=UPI001CCE831E|nr:hypothetical protein [Hyalangium gracile]